MLEAGNPVFYTSEDRALLPQRDLSETRSHPNLELAPEMTGNATDLAESAMDVLLEASCLRIFHDDISGSSRFVYA